MRSHYSFSIVFVFPHYTGAVLRYYLTAALLFLMSSFGSSKNHLTLFPYLLGKKKTSDQGTVQHFGVFSKTFTLPVSKDWERGIYLFLNSAYTWMKLHFLFDSMFYFIITFPPSQQLQKDKEKVELLMWSKSSVASVGKRHTFICSTF